MPGVRARPHVRAVVAVARPDRRHRPRHPARPAGDGLRGAGRAARDHRAVHDRHLPRRLRPRRPVADPRPRPGLVARPDDRRDDPAARRRQRGDGDRPRRDAGAHGRARHGRRRASPSSASSPTCSRTPCGPATWPASPIIDLHRPAAQAVRVLDRRERPRRRGCARSSRASRPDQPLGARDRAAEPGHHPGPQAAVAADARHPHRGRRRDRRSRSCSTSPPAASSVIGVLPQGFPVPTFPAVPVDDLPLLFAAAVGISLVAIGDTISVVRRLRGAGRLRGGRQPGARRDRLGQPRGRPVLRLPGEHERLPDGRGLPVRGEDAADRASSRPRLVLADARCSCPAWSRRCRSRCSPRSSSRPRSACSTSPSCAGSSAVAPDGVRAGRRLRARRHVHRRPRGDRRRGRPVGRSTSSSGRGRRTRPSWEDRPASPAGTTSGATRTREQVPGLLIVRWSAPLFFANANQFRDRIRELVQGREAGAALGPRRRRADHGHRHDRRRDARGPRPRAERGRDPPRLRRAPVGRPGRRSCATGCSRRSTRATSTAR